VLRAIRAIPVRKACREFRVTKVTPAPRVIKAIRVTQDLKASRAI
jgi:hypothetical protein